MEQVARTRINTPTKNFIFMALSFSLLIQLSESQICSHPLYPMARWSEAAGHRFLHARATYHQTLLYHPSLLLPGEINKINFCFPAEIRSLIPSLRCNLQYVQNATNHRCTHRRDRRSSGQEHQARLPIVGVIERSQLPVFRGAVSNPYGLTHDCQSPSLLRGARGSALHPCSE